MPVGINFRPSIEEIACNLFAMGNHPLLVVWPNGFDLPHLDQYGESELFSRCECGELNAVEHVHVSSEVIDYYHKLHKEQQEQIELDKKVGWVWSDNDHLYHYYINDKKGQNISICGKWVHSPRYTFIYKDSVPKGAIACHHCLQAKGI